MALSKLGAGDENAMQLLAGWAGNEDSSAKQGGGQGLLNLGLERIARAALNLISSGQAALRELPGLFPGDDPGRDGSGEAE